MKTSIFTITLLALSQAAHAAVLSTLPTPGSQGSGMLHINVSLQGNSLFAHPESGTPVIQPLTAWKPGDSFDPASPWYSTLDPSQEGGMFNSQFGLLIEAAATDPLPTDSKIMVAWVSGTPGLKAFQWKNTATQAFNPILGTNGSSTSWDWSTVAHGMMHPMFVMPAGSSGPASATLSFTLTDLSGTALAGYNSTQATLNFNVVPEPSSLALTAGAGLLLIRRRRHNSLS